MQEIPITPASKYGQHSGEPSGTLAMAFKEVYDLSSTQLITCNCYVPISCRDLQQLDTARMLLSRNGHCVDASTPNSLFFFGNHPIKWVQIVGKALDVQYHFYDEPTEGSFSVVDGLGGHPSKCYINARGSPVRHRIKAGQMVVILGQLSAASRVDVVKLYTIAPKDIALYFFLREHTIAARKYVLEKDADQFKGLVPALKSIEKPKQLLTDITMEQTYLLRRFLTRKRSAWGVESGSLTEISGLRLVWP